jgi:hypothetical protein
MLEVSHLSLDTLSPPSASGPSLCMPPGSEAVCRWERQGFRSTMDLCNSHLEEGGGVKPQFNPLPAPHVLLSVIPNSSSTENSPGLVPGKLSPVSSEFNSLFWTLNSHSTSFEYSLESQMENLLSLPPSFLPPPCFSLSHPHGSNYSPNYRPLPCHLPLKDAPV